MHESDDYNDGNITQELGYEPSQFNSAQIQQLISNYRLTPATLMAECCDWWYPAPFLQHLAAEIAALIARGGGGLLVSAPPRHGKSKLITVATPLWVLENFPKKQVIVATYGEDLSTDFTREVKDIIKANPDKLSIRIRRDVDRAQNFVTPQGGGLKAVGLRGTITGRGANVLIIDDYIKEPKEALNHSYLESLKTWYATVARTRLEPGAVVIIVATRWVTNDLHGHIERLEKRRPRPFYKIVKIQAIAGTRDQESGVWRETPGAPDLLGRKPGEALFPQRYTAEQLEDVRVELGNRWFEAMFQQNPQSEESAVTNPENLRYISRRDFEALKASAGRRTTRFREARAWDFASTKEAGDYTCGTKATFDTDTNFLYIEGMARGQWSAGRVEQVYESHAKADEPRVDYLIEQEPGASGSFAVEHFRMLSPNHKVKANKAAADGSKLLKAQPFIAATEAHAVWLVVDDVADVSLDMWVAPLIDEFVSFPEGAHDDIMDTLSILYNHFTGRKPLAGAFGRSRIAQEKARMIAEGDGSLEATDANVRFGRVVFGRASPETARPKKAGVLGGSRTRTRGFAALAQQLNRR